MDEMNSLHSDLNLVGDDELSIDAVKFKKNSSLIQAVQETSDSKKTVNSSEVPGNKENIIYGSIRIPGLNININGNHNMCIINHGPTGSNPENGFRNSFRCDHKISSPNEIKTLKVRKGMVPAKVARDIAGHLGAEWRNLGLQLNFNNVDLDILQHDHRDAVEISYRMIMKWIEKLSLEATYKNLGDALMKIRRCDVVKNCLLSSVNE